MSRLLIGVLSGLALSGFLSGCAQGAPGETDTAEPVEATTTPSPTETQSEKSPHAEMTTLITLDDAVEQCIKYFSEERSHYALESDFIMEWGGPLDVNNPPVNVVIGYMDGEYYMEFANDAQPDNNVWCRTENGYVALVGQPGISVYERYMYR